MDIRHATDDDLDGILAIYNAAIVETTAIWTDEVVDRSNREQWLADQLAVGHPVLVATDSDGAVMGYASFAQWRAKYGYRYSVEDSIYVGSAYRGRGVARALMVELIARAKAAGMHLMVADIETGNIVSIRLHESLGFETSGVVRELGTKFDRWLDLTIMTLRLDLP